MLFALPALAALSRLPLIAGPIWLPVRSDETTYESGGEIGQEIIAEQMRGEWEEPAAQKQP